MVFGTAVFSEDRRDFAADFDAHDLLTKLCSKEAWGVVLSWGNKSTELEVLELNLNNEISII